MGPIEPREIHMKTVLIVMLSFAHLPALFSLNRLFLSSGQTVHVIIYTISFDLTEKHNIVLQSKYFDLIHIIIII